MFKFQKNRRRGPEQRYLQYRARENRAEGMMKITLLMLLERVLYNTRVGSFSLLNLILYLKLETEYNFSVIYRQIDTRGVDTYIDIILEQEHEQ